MLGFADRYIDWAGSVPRFAFAGGSAVQGWLWDTGHDRPHRDLDLLVVDDFPGNTAANAAGFLGRGFTSASLLQDGLLVPETSYGALVQFVRGCYFDAEITPTLADIRPRLVGGRLLPLLSPEFVLISKLTYPNVRRRVDIQDVLALRRECHIDWEYAGSLYARTAMAASVMLEEIMSAADHGGVEAVLDLVHRRMLWRFLHWTVTDVAALTPQQAFVLLDTAPGDSTVPPAAARSLLACLSAQLPAHLEPVARTGTWLITCATPPACARIYHQQRRLRQFLKATREDLERSPTAWLARCKGSAIMLGDLGKLLRALRGPGSIPPVQDIVVASLRRILVSKVNRFGTQICFRVALHDLQRGAITRAECIAWLSTLAGGKDAPQADQARH